MSSEKTCPYCEDCRFHYNKNAKLDFMNKSIDQFGKEPADRFSKCLNRAKGGAPRKHKPEIYLVSRNPSKEDMAEGCVLCTNERNDKDLSCLSIWWNKLFGSYGELPCGKEGRHFIPNKEKLVDQL